MNGVKNGSFTSLPAAYWGIAENVDTNAKRPIRKPC